MRPVTLLAVPSGQGCADELPAPREQPVAVFERASTRSHIVLYAREHCSPQLARIDQAKVASLYAELRRESARGGGVPIAVRHIESLMRMAEARADKDRNIVRLTADINQLDIAANLIANLASVGVHHYILVADQGATCRKVATRLACVWSTLLEPRHTNRLRSAGTNEVRALWLVRQMYVGRLARLGARARRVSQAGLESRRDGRHAARGCGARVGDPWAES
mgnify:CR=1 FL=1